MTPTFALLVAGHLFMLWGAILVLWIRVRRLEKQPDPQPCTGALCRDGELPNGDLCRLCNPHPPRRPGKPSRPANPPGPPLGLSPYKRWRVDPDGPCRSCNGFYSHAPSCTRLD